MFNNLSIKARLNLIMLFMSALLLGGAVIGLYGISENGKGIKAVYEDRTVPLVDLGRIIDMVNRIRTNTVVIVNAGLPEVAEAAHAETLVLDREIDKLWAKLISSRLSPDEKLLTDEFNSQWKTYQTSRDVTLKLAMVDDEIVDAQQNATNDAGPKFTAARETLFKLIELQGAVAKQEFIQANDRSVNIRNFAIIAVIVGLALAAWLSLSLIRAIVRDRKSVV